MLLSFLATLEDGFRVSTSVSRKDAQARQNDTEIGGETGLKNIASLLGLHITLSGQYARKATSESNVEETFIREHTAASMFNKLYGIFKNEEILTRVEGADGLEDLRPGHIVEISGDVRENPLEFLFDTMTQILPFLNLVFRLQQGSSKTNKGNPQPAKKAQQRGPEIAPGIDMQLATDLFEGLRADISSAPVTDIVLDAGFCRVVITASRGFLTDSGRAALIGGSFTTLGKVTSVGLSADDSVSIVRRGSLAAFGELQQQMGSLIKSSREQFSSEMPETTITGPYVQIMPLAIYV